MFFSKRRTEIKEKKENEARLRKLDGREVRYVTTRDGITYIESIIGKYGVISIKDDEFSIICDNKLVFGHSIEGLRGSELMSLDGIILDYVDTASGEVVEVITYYKYHRK